MILRKNSWLFYRHKEKIKKFLEIIWKTTQFLGQGVGKIKTFLKSSY